MRVWARILHASLSDEIVAGCMCRGRVCGVASETCVVSLCMGTASAAQCVVLYGREDERQKEVFRKKKKKRETSRWRRKEREEMNE